MQIIYTIYQRLKHWSFTFCTQESSIAIAKFLLPQLFEKFSLQEVRCLIVEKSIMKNYINGEVIEMVPNSICILLEGFVRTEDSSLITPPGVLLPLNTELSFLSFEQSGKIELI